jgi:hypothetical protein
VKIKTNHHYRHLIYWHELTEAEQAEHHDAYDEVQESTFFRYRGWVYDVNGFLRVRQEHSLYGWDGYMNESFFSAVLVKYNEDLDAVKVGRSAAIC